MTTLDNNINFIEKLEKLEKLVIELTIKNTSLEERIESLEKNIENLEKHNAITKSIDIDIDKGDNNILNEVILDSNITRSFSFTNLHNPSIYIPRRPSLNDVRLCPPPVLRQTAFHTNI
jgi:hypothetical protein